MPKARPFKLKSGEVVWRVQFRIDGSVKTETFPNKAGGDKFADWVEKYGGQAARDLLEKRKESGHQIPTLAEWTATYLSPESGILTGIQPSTRRDYERIAGSFLPMLGDHPIDAITRDDIGKWVHWLEQQPSASRKGQTIAPKTVLNYQAVLSNIFKAAVERDLIKRNPVKGIRVTKGQSREGVFLTHDEFERILNNTLDHYKPLVIFLAYTGARWGEATALTWADIDLTKITPTASINKAWKKGVDGVPVLGVPKSAKGRRSIPLPQKVVDNLPHRRAGDQLVFHGVEGGRLWYGMFNTRIWKRAVERADVGKTPNIHDLRHTYASWLLAAGAPINVVQAKMGHEKIDTTVAVYGHLAPGADADIVRVLDAMNRPLELEA